MKEVNATIIMHQARYFSEIWDILPYKAPLQRIHPKQALTTLVFKIHFNLTGA